MQKSYFQAYPGITLAMQGRYCGGMGPTMLAKIAILMAGLEALLLAVILLFLAISIYHVLKKNKSSFSETTYKLHRQLTISLIVQV